MKTWKINVAHKEDESKSYGFTLERSEAPSEQEIRDTLDKDQYPQDMVEITITEVRV